MKSGERMSEYCFRFRILVDKMGVSQRSLSVIALKRDLHFALGRKASPISDPKRPPQFCVQGRSFLRNPKNKDAR